MKRLSILALAALAAPAVLAQTYYAYPVDRDEIARCMDREDTLNARRLQLSGEKQMNDRESASIARASDALADDLRRVNPSDPVSVATHNARAEEHNRRVEAHNLRVYDMNLAAREQNIDQSDQYFDCRRPR